MHFLTKKESYFKRDISPLISSPFFLYYLVNFTMRFVLINLVHNIDLCLFKILIYHHIEAWNHNKYLLISFVLLSRLTTIIPPRLHFNYYILTHSSIILYLFLEYK